MATKPTLPPADPRKHFMARLQAMVEGDDVSGEEAAITYRVSGGPPKQRLDYSLEIRGTGSVSAHITDELEPSRDTSVKESLVPDRVATLFREILDSRLLENEDTGHGFLPDSVIGSITVGDRASTITYHFLADDQQRRNQGRFLNPSVSRVYAALERLSAEILSDPRTRERKQREAQKE